MLRHLISLSAGVAFFAAATVVGTPAVEAQDVKQIRWATSSVGSSGHRALVALAKRHSARIASLSDADTARAASAAAYRRERLTHQLVITSTRRDDVLRRAFRRCALLGAAGGNNRFQTARDDHVRHAGECSCRCLRFRN